MLWELWYGQRAFFEFSGPITAFSSWVDEGNRPGDVESGKKPPPDLKQLMSQCWDGNPEQRPTAEICKQQITALNMS